MPYLRASSGRQPLPTATGSRSAFESMVVPLPPRAKRCERYSTTEKVTGNEDESDGGGQEHAADDDGAEDAAGSRAGAGGDPQRQAAEDEGESGHHDGAEAQAGRIQRGFADALAALVVGLRELDDQDGVLRGEADQHDEADGGKDVVLKRADVQSEIPPRMATGVLSRTLKGSVQLSYRAARIRKTKSSESPKTAHDGTPFSACCSW